MAVLKTRVAGATVEVGAPSDAVLSVDGRTGTVSLSDLYDAAGAAAAAQAASQPADADLTTLSGAGNSAVLAAMTAAFLTADETKLDGIETGATADQTAAEILTALLTVDGAGSGLDADLLDGNSSAAFETPAGAQAKADAKVTQTITDGVTTTAPSEDVTFDALALKMPLVAGASDGDVVTWDDVEGEWQPQAPVVSAVSTESVSAGDLGASETLTESALRSLKLVEASLSAACAVTVDIDTAGRAIQLVVDGGGFAITHTGVAVWHTSSGAEPGALTGINTILYVRLESGDVHGYWADEPLDADLTALAAAGNSAVLAASTASFLTADETKLDGIEALADVTDAANVEAAGAVMAATLAASGKGFVEHGATAATARPDDYASVEWFGTVEPDNWVDGDTWNSPA